MLFHLKTYHEFLTENLNPEISSRRYQHFPHHDDVICQKCDPDNSLTQPR